MERKFGHNYRTTKNKTLEDRFDEDGQWGVSSGLFGDVGVDINDFEAENYAHFLDNVTSLEDLVRGLEQLSPLADDALRVAERMDMKAFTRFKRALTSVRLESQEPQQLSSAEYVAMPKRFHPLLMPEIFFRAAMLTEDFGVPLGAVAVRIVELQEGTEQ